MKKRKMSRQALEICSDSGETILSISEDYTDGKMKMTLTGKITSEVTHDFEDELMAVLSFCHTIEIDMGALTYIAGLALQSLLSVQQMIDEIDGARMIITAVSDEVYTIIKNVGYDEILELEQ